MEAKKENMGASRAKHGVTVRDRFNPDMLRTAREARGLSQAELGKRLGVAQSLIGKWESELRVPSQEQVKELASELGVTQEFFNIDRPRKLASLSDFYHRALSRARRSEVKAVHARCCIFDIQIDRLLNLAEIPNDVIPYISSADSPPERIAEEARAAMGVTPGPISNLIRVIEDAGGIVIDRQIEVDEVDALCRWVPELPKLFFLNGSKPPDRTRFSLAHELGHTVMHFGRAIDVRTAEDEASAFASAFLMPANEIRRDFRPGFGIPELAAIKRKWRVSMQAAAKRAFSIGVIDERRYRFLCLQISRKGWRKVEPVSIAGESPRTLGKLLQAHLDAGFSVNELSKLLFVPVESIDEMLVDSQSPTYEDDEVRLRIVRD